jgi:gas vesicle protein
MKTGNVILSLLSGIAAGAAAGVAMGILYAPDKGSETRRRISTKGEELRGNLKHKFEGVREDASELLERGKSKIYEVRDDLSNI